MIADGAATRLLPFASRLVGALYPDPSELATAEQFARAGHADVSALSDDQLTDERLLALLRRAVERAARRRGDRPSDWLRERIARLDQEAARRRAAKRKRGLR